MSCNCLAFSTIPHEENARALQTKNFVSFPSPSIHLSDELHSILLVLGKLLLGLLVQSLEECSHRLAGELAVKGDNIARVMGEGITNQTSRSHVSFDVKRALILIRLDSLTRCPW